MPRCTPISGTHLEECEPIGAVDGERLEQHGIDEAEDARVGANRDADREHGHRREPRVAAEDADGVADVGEQVFDHGNRAHRAPLRSGTEGTEGTEGTVLTQSSGEAETNREDP